MHRCARSGLRSHAQTCPLGELGVSKPARSARISEVVLGFLEHSAQCLFHLVEMGLVADQRRRELDQRVAAVSGSAVDHGFEEGRGQAAP